MKMNDIWLAIVKMAIREAKNIVDDQEALEVKVLYDNWNSKLGEVLVEGEYIQHNDKLYRVIKEHTAQSTWAPGEGTESLFVVVNKNSTGASDDPIPYDGNMILEQGKYYIQNDVVYVCSRDTINPVYNNLNDLIGLYVEKVVETTADGSIDNPIIFEKGNVVVKNLYYLENGIKYHCILNSGGPLYHNLSSLVGLYVIVDNSNYL